MIPITLNQNTTLLIECLFAGMALLIIALIVWAVIITINYNKLNKLNDAQNQWNYKFTTNNIKDVDRLTERTDGSYKMYVKLHTSISELMGKFETFKKELTETKYPINQYRKKK